MEGEEVGGGKGENLTCKLNMGSIRYDQVNTRAGPRWLNTGSVQSVHSMPQDGGKLGCLVTVQSIALEAKKLGKKFG